jgi:DNA polymerase-3 subunit delta'
MPDLFSHILDQSEPIAQLLSAYRNGRLPHGVIFAGPVGVGKATTARALAKLFLCDEGQDAYGMGLVDAETHPDYHVITKELIRLTSKTSKATTLSVDVVRDHLVTPAMKKTVIGKGKVFVVEEADLMQTPAQNSILKTLEEPAGRTLIILLTPRPDDLLATIRSRAQVFRFGQLTDATVFNQLKLRGIDPATSEAATKIADGSLGTALRWIEDGVVAQARDLISHLDGLLMGRPTADIGDWLKIASDAYAAKQLERDDKSSKDNATRTGIATYLRLIGRHLRSALRSTDDPDTLEAICQAIDHVNRCETYLDGNVNTSLALQQLGNAFSDLFAPASLLR